MINQRFFYSLSKASLALALSFPPLVGHAQPSLDFSGALSAAALLTPPVLLEVPALTVAGFESIPDALLAYLCTYSSEDERCSRTRQISKKFDRAVTETLRLQYPLEEMIHSIPKSLREKATARDIVNHALAPLRAIQLIGDYEGVSRSTDAFEEEFPDTTKKEILIRRLKHLAIQLYPASDSQPFISTLISWMKHGLSPERHAKLERLVEEFQDQLNLSEMPLTYDLVALCQLRGIGMEEKADLEKNSFIKSLQKLKKESEISKKMLPLIRSLRLNDYLTLKAQLWPLVTQVQDVKPKVDLPPLTKEQLENFQLLKETNLLDAAEAFECGLFFDNQKDSERAFHFYEDSARLGHSTAQLNLGVCFEQGDGTLANTDSALYYFHLAALQNSADAHFYRGHIFIGRSLQGDPDLALHEYLKSAELYQTEKNQSGYLTALVEMAYLHFWGDLTSPDPALAIRYLHQAEEGKKVDAYQGLAYCYRFGLGVEKSLETALDYLKNMILEGTDEQKTLAEEARKTWIEERETK